MKRPKSYMHRPGMRFDRRHVQGPDAGFIGSDVEVTTITGSVWPSINQQDGEFAVERLGSYGYPRNPYEMKMACAGYGEWGAGFLFEEETGRTGVTSSFPAPDGASPKILSASQGFTNIRFRGERGPVPFDDWAVTSTGSTYAGAYPTSMSFSTSQGFHITGTQDFAVIAVMKWNYNASNTVAPTQVILGSNNVGANFGNGGRPQIGIQDNAGFFIGYGPYLSTGYIGVNCPQNTAFYTGPNVWWIVLFGWSHADQLMSVHFRPVNWLYRDLETNWETRDTGPYSYLWGSTQGTGYFGDLETALVGVSGSGIDILGPMPNGNPFISYAAIYIATGSNAASGVLANRYDVLDSFAECIKAPSRGAWLLTGSTDVANSVGSFGSYQDTRLVNQQLLGLGTGSLGRAQGLSTVLTSSVVPSWTNAHLGQNAAFIIPTLSSSNHESQVLGAFVSGTEPLESSAVPASATLYYSKKTKYSKVVVKKSASYFDTVAPSGYAKGVNGFYPPAQFLPGSGSLMSLISSSIDADMSTPYTPGVLLFDVPVSGKLVDISVWVELHHQSASVPIMPLGAIGLGLKSPNVNPGMGHPMLNFNDPSIGSIFGNGDAYGAWKDTFILWEGPGALMLDQRTYGLGPNHFGYSDVREKFPGWDRDLSMRTVFNDSAPVNNPRHNIPFSVGSASYVGSPNAAVGINSAWGMAINWTGSAGSPPAGWLSGPGGTAAVNEWPTTGSNRGAAYIKPLYPLLDPIEVTIPAGNYPTEFFGQKASPDKFVGTRPGLRGSEISGTWKLTFWTGNDDDGTVDYQMPVYFRQARIEITYEQHEPIGRTRMDSGVSAHIPGRRKVWQTSGSNLSSFISASNDVHVVDTQRSSIGRTFGIVLNTGSINPNGAALIYRLTGTLAEYSGSAPGWLLNNEFGMPSIPLSSASLVPVVVEPVVTVHPQDLLSTRPILGAVQRLADAAKDASEPQTREEYAAEVVTEETADE